MNITRFELHPNYNEDTFEYDVALFELETVIPFHTYPTSDQ